MTIKFSCPACQKVLQAPADKIGANTRCPGCKEVLQVPSATDESEHFLRIVPDRGPPPLPSSQFHCRNCGNAVAENAAACLSCGLSPHDGDLFCPSCGAATNPKAVICVKCGIGLKAEKQSGSASSNRAVSKKSRNAREREDHEAGLVYPTDPPKDPTMMCILSVLIIGLGQILMGQTKKGWAILGGTIGLCIITCGIAALGAPIYWAISGYDAYKIATKLKDGQPVREWEWF